MSQHRRSRIRITPAIVRELLEYEPETGVFTWRHRSLHWFPNESRCKAWNSAFAGRPAGSLRNQETGYRFRAICLFNRPHKAHRLAWMHMVGTMPPAQIDHINRDATDNRWANLRNGTSINNKNQGIFRHNTSGISGVHWRKNSNKWVARGSVTVHGIKQRVALGTYSTLLDAVAARLRFEREHGYSPGHGRATPRQFDGITQPRLPSQRPAGVIGKGGRRAAD